MSLQRKIIDLTGRKGLTFKYGGDITASAYQTYGQAGQPNLRYLAQEGEMVSGIYNPIKKYGFLSPANNLFLNVSQAAFGSPLADHVSSSLVDSLNDKIYFADDDNNLYIAGFDGANSTQFSLGSNGISRATDMAIYYLNGVRMGFVIGTAAGNRSIIKTFTLAAGSPTINDDWSLTDVSGAFDMTESFANKLIPAGDGFMYVLNANFVHRVDGSVLGGTNGTIVRNVLAASSGTNFTNGIEYNNYMYMVLQTNSNWSLSIGQQNPRPQSTSKNSCGVYVWNKQSSFYNSSNYIDLPGVDHVRALWVSPKNELHVMGVSASNEVLIMKLNGSKFAIVKSLQFGVQPVNSHGLKIYGAFAYWIGSDGFVYMYGSENSAEQDALFVIGQYQTGGVGSGEGAVIAMVNAGSTNLSTPNNTRSNIDTMYIMGEFTSNTYKFQQFFPHATDTVEGNAIPRLTGDIYSPVDILPTLSNVKHINIICAPTPGISGSTVEANVKIYFNMSSTAWATKTVTRDDIAKGYVSYEVNKPFVNSVQLEIEYNQASNAGVADFNPAYAEVVFEATTTIR